MLFTIHHTHCLDDVTTDILKRLISEAVSMNTRLDTLSKGIQKIMDNTAKTDQAIAALTTSVANLTTAEASAETLLTGLSTALAAALASASNAGATDTQLAELTALQASIDSGKDGLVAAVAANTLPTSS